MFSLILFALAEDTPESPLRSNFKSSVIWKHVDRIPWAMFRTKRTSYTSFEINFNKLKKSRTISFSRHDKNTINRAKLDARFASCATGLVDNSELNRFLFSSAYFSWHISLNKNWSRRPDLNRRPVDYESTALPTELRRPFTKLYDNS